MSEKIEKLSIYTDGASRGNPGPAGIGIVVTRNGKILYEDEKYLGKHTNNEAEYRAIIKALEIGERYKAQKLNITSDSQLVIKQLKGLYRVKAKNLKPLHEKIKQKEEKFKEVKYKHKNRTNKYIERADQLANKALNLKNY